MQQQGGIWKFEGYRQDGTYFPIELSIAKIPNEKSISSDRAGCIWTNSPDAGIAKPTSKLSKV